VILSIAAQPLAYEFSVRPVAGEPICLGSAPTKDLSSEKIGGFTGVYFGMYATGNGQESTVPADFAWFDYRIEER